MLSALGLGKETRWGVALSVLTSSLKAAPCFVILQDQGSVTPPQPQWDKNIFTAGWAKTSGCGVNASMRIELLGAGNSSWSNSCCCGRRDHRIRSLSTETNILQLETSKTMEYLQN